MDDQSNHDTSVGAASTSVEVSELRRYIDERFGSIEERLTAGDERMQGIESEIKENTVVTRDVYEFLQAMRSGFKALGWLGEAGKWLLKVAGPFIAMAGIYHSWKNGDPPHK